MDTFWKERNFPINRLFFRVKIEKNLGDKFLKNPTLWFSWNCVRLRILRPWYKKWYWKLATLAFHDKTHKNHGSLRLSQKIGRILKNVLDESCRSYQSTYLMLCTFFEYLGWFSRKLVKNVCGVKHAVPQWTFVF